MLIPIPVSLEQLNLFETEYEELKIKFRKEHEFIQSWAIKV